MRPTPGWPAKLGWSDSRMGWSDRVGWRGEHGWLVWAWCRQWMRTGRQAGAIFGCWATVSFALLSAPVGLVAAAIAPHSAILGHGLIGLWLSLLALERLGSALALAGRSRTATIVVALLPLVAALVCLRVNLTPTVAAATAGAALAACGAAEPVAARVVAYPDRRWLRARVIGWLGGGALILVFFAAAPHWLSLPLALAALAVGLAEVGWAIAMLPPPATGTPDVPTVAGPVDPRRPRPAADTQVIPLPRTLGPSAETQVIAFPPATASADETQVIPAVAPPPAPPGGDASTTDTQVIPLPDGRR